MGKKQKFDRRGSKLTLTAFLQLDLSNSTCALAHQSKTLPALKNKRGANIVSAISAENYVENNPTPTEAHARQNFNGLCFECQMIFATWKEPTGIGIPRHERKNAHHNFKDLENCWCPICKMLLHDLLRSNDKPVQELRLSANCSTPSDVRVYEHMRLTTCYYVELVFRFQNWWLAPSFRMFIPGEDSGSTTGTLQSSTNSTQIWTLANKWLQECRDWHLQCSTTHVDKMLPTRLLQVGTSDTQLRLVQSESLPDYTEYATLSHCWGSKAFMTLTQDNINSFLIRIQFERLSKTIRDAITAARNLGFQYLWIDSMCVIQHDEKDWQHEASRMSHVYSNSTLNFAAADSPDGDTGCFFDDRPNFPNAWKVTFPPTGPVPPSTMRFDSDYDPASKQYTWNCISSGTRAIIDESKLASRAWTLQERLLSPRTLYFGRDQTAWECRVCNGYEALPDLFDEGIMKLSPGNYFALLEEVNPLASHHNVRQWSDIVENYTRRSLTVSSDKLVAISGLARILASVYGPIYVAGLWVRDLIRLLTWHLHPSNELTAKNLTAKYRAPSWSWASVDGRVSFPSGFVQALEGEYAQNDDELLYPPLAKVLETVTTYPEDQFGEVTSGFIHIRVRALFRATVDTRKWVHNRPFPVPFIGIGEIEQFTAYPDYNLESIEGESLLMPLAEGVRDYPNDYPEMRGLFLERTEEGIYRRKGAWRVGGQFSESGFEDMNKVTRMWHAKGIQRLRDRNEVGLDQREFASLWDGEAYILKII